MKTHREVGLKPRNMPLPKQRAKGLCRWCDQPVPDGRRTWCSEKCVENYLIRARPSHARYKVWGRDKGVCELCGLDMKAVAKSINRRARRYPTAGRARDFLGAILPYSCVSMFRGQWGFSRCRKEPSWMRPLDRKIKKKQEWLERIRHYPGVEADGLWHMDHRVPVAEGGGSCGLDNLRTLCRWCHAKETATLKRRLARKKLKQKEMFG